LSDIPATIDLNPSGAKTDASVIWLHGLGADGNDFVPIAERFNLQGEYNVRFVFPHAPIRPITVNGGMRMRGWYDIEGLDLSQKEDSVGIKESAKLLGLLIEREESLGIQSNRIVIAGFSQGGAIALYTGLRFQRPLAGIIALSTYLPLPETLNGERHVANQNAQVFMAHGMFDPIIPLMLGQLSKEQIQGLGYSLEWHSYPMAHSVIPEQIQDIGEFLRKVLK
jgi:phospholipase/carboxylesterase